MYTYSFDIIEIVFNIPEEHQLLNSQWIQILIVLNFKRKSNSKRLQPHIQHLVKDNQTGFVKGRQITEGFLYAQQIIQTAKSKHVTLALFKADIHKAFDTIKWDFLVRVMEGLGFPIRWIS